MSTDFRFVQLLALWTLFGVKCICTDNGLVWIVSFGFLSASVLRRANILTQYNSVLTRVQLCTPAKWNSLASQIKFSQINKAHEIRSEMYGPKATRQRIHDEPPMRNQRGNSETLCVSFATHEQTAEEKKKRLPSFLLVLSVSGAAVFFFSVAYVSPNSAG